jgi:alpha-glucosidase (family GH31 glycosyl hydrolase)
MDDDEMHNLYPLLYARQMLEGFEKHTGRRGLTFTPSGWVGFQAWAGTWTGDTGGGAETIAAMLNTAIVGHSWATNDMEVTRKEALHFGYLLPWAQINSWNYFRMPWLQGRKLLEAHRAYSRFRARLIPYLYSWARQATLDGFPLMAPLTLAFPREPACRDNLLQFLLGRDLLVCAFSNTAWFPPGDWFDLWSGKIIAGGREHAISWPEERGGGLYLRQGGILPFGPVMQYRGERPLDEIEVLAFPGPEPSGFELYEDDGVSLAYRQGACAITEIAAQRNGDEIELRIGPTRGQYEGMPAARAWSARVITRVRPQAIRIDGVPAPEKQWDYDETAAAVVVKELRPPCTLAIRCECTP